MKTKEIIASVNKLKSVFKTLCQRCQKLPSETNLILADMRDAWNSRYAKLVMSMKSDAENMEPLIEELRGAFRAVCLTCSKMSNDDNPSNHGQSFVSLDSGTCQAKSGMAKSTHTDDNIMLSRADWIAMHKAADIEERNCDPGARMMMEEEQDGKPKEENESSSILPPEVEDRLRKEFANFVALDIQDKLLLSCLMSGMNIAEFAKMLWFPYSMVDPKTRQVKSITKQAAHARWVNICKRFPVFISVAANSCRGSEKAKARFKKFMQDPNGDESSHRFQNGKMKSAFAKNGADWMAGLKDEMTESDVSEKASADSYMKTSFVKGRRSHSHLRKRNLLSMFPDKQEDCLPGLF